MDLPECVRRLDCVDRRLFVQLFCLRGRPPPSRVYGRPPAEERNTSKGSVVSYPTGSALGVLYCRPVPTAEAAIIQAVRATRPVVHCLTNAVTIGRVADALAALGAHPVMAAASAEAADMLAHADALVINLGTPDADRWPAARAAATRARERRVPIVIDPVGCGATSWRTEQTRALVRAVRPDIVRGSAPEVAALACLAPPASRQRGVAAQDQPELDPVALAAAASSALGSVVVVSGRRDALSDGQRRLAHTTGLSALDRVVGAGDVLSSLIGACTAVEHDRISAAWAGLSVFAAAARSADQHSHGPGSFWVSLLDALARPSLDDCLEPFPVEQPGAAV
jgi:hydroxyethylthiazole kinase